MSEEVVVMPEETELEIGSVPLPMVEVFREQLQAGRVFTNYKSKPRGTKENPLKLTFYHSTDVIEIHFGLGNKVFEGSSEELEECLRAFSATKIIRAAQKYADQCREQMRREGKRQ
jgi:hypothetical protein